MTKDARSKFKEAEAQVDIGLGGLFGHLGAALNEALSKLEEAGEVHHETTIDTGRGPVRASAGVHIRTMGGAPERSRKPEQPVNPTKAQPETETETPKSNDRPINGTILSDGDTWSLVAELPGISADEIEIETNQLSLVIRASGRGRTYIGTFTLPREVTTDEINQSMVNGILELSIAKEKQ